MKIALIMNARMPTEKAHGYQIAKMCEALSVTGAEVSLVLPTRKNDTKSDIFSYYGVQNNFSVQYLPTFDALNLFGFGRIGFYAQAISFLGALGKIDVAHDAVIFTRNPEIAWHYARRGYRVFFDAHNFPSRGVAIFKWQLKKISGVIANSNGTANAFRKEGFEKVLVAPNAVDLEQFANAEVLSRSVLGLPADRIAMYVGHLYEWKGADVVVGAVRLSKDNKLTFVIVGGTDKDIACYRAKTHGLSNVLFLGHRSRKEIPTLLKSADVLLLPNVPVTQESILYTSPIKMFEYMASGVPIVASDLPSIREVLDKTNSILVNAGDPAALLAGIAQALEPDAQKVASLAKEQAKDYTWGSRARKILDFIRK